MVRETKNGKGVLLLFVKWTYFLISGYYILAIINNNILSTTKLIFWSRLEVQVGEENGEKV